MPSHIFLGYPLSRVKMSAMEILEDYDGLSKNHMHIPWLSHRCPPTFSPGYPRRQNKVLVVEVLEDSYLFVCKPGSSGEENQFLFGEVSSCALTSSWLAKGCSVEASLDFFFWVFLRFFRDVTWWYEFMTWYQAMMWNDDMAHPSMIQCDVMQYAMMRYDMMI